MTPTFEQRRRVLAHLVRSLDHTDLPRSLRRITESAAEGLGVARASVWLWDRERTRIRCADLYQATTGEHSGGYELTANEFPSYFLALREERVIDAHDARTDARTREFRDSYLAPLGITAMLDVPILLGGEMVGVACHEHVAGEARTWTVEEQLFAGSVGDLAALAMEACERHRAQEDLRRSEAQLREAQKMEALGRLAGGVAHDFNNLLTIVLCSADELLAHGPDVRTRTQAERIQSAAMRAAALTQRLLAFGRRQVIQLQTFDLRQLVHEMVPLLGRILGEDVQIGVDLGAVPATVRADRGQLEQVLLNLALNARDAMPTGGRVHVDVEVVAGRDGPEVRLAVRDTGVGMTPEVLAHAFEPFFTTKAPGRGSGLGLAMVHGIVTGAGGRVGVTSELGRGAAFEVCLPWADPDLDPEPTPVTDEPEARPDAAPSPKNVLVVEDEPGLLEGMSAALRRSGYVVVTASDAEEALQLADRLTEPCDLLVSDVVLPRMRGPELALELLRRWPAMRVLLVSGHARDALPAESTHAFLAKPFTVAALARKVREVLEAQFDPKGAPPPGPPEIQTTPSDGE